MLYIVIFKQTADNVCVHRLTDVVPGVLAAEAKAVVPCPHLDTADPRFSVSEWPTALSYKAGRSHLDVTVAGDCRVPRHHAVVDEKRWALVHSYLVVLERRRDVLKERVTDTTHRFPRRDVSPKHGRSISIG